MNFLKYCITLLVFMYAANIYVDIKHETIVLGILALSVAYLIKPDPSNQYNFRDVITKDRSSNGSQS